MTADCVRWGEENETGALWLERAGEARACRQGWRGTGPIGLIDDIAGAALSPDSLAKLSKADASRLPKVDAATRLGPCVGNVGKFICVGLNYADHAGIRRRATEGTGAVHEGDQRHFGAQR